MMNVRRCAPALVLALIICLACGASGSLARSASCDPDQPTTAIAVSNDSGSSGGQIWGGNAYGAAAGCGNRGFFSGFFDGNGVIAVAQAG